MSAEVISESQPRMSLYKFVNADGLQRILEGSVRFTQPGAFNDPFELLPEFVMPMAKPGQQIADPEDITLRFDVLAQRRHPSVGEVEDVPEGHVSFDPTARDIVKALNEKIGFFCLSKNCDSLLMWSHYADQYAGAVVEFDAGYEFFANPIEIEYRDRRPKKDRHIYLSEDAIPVAELCVKSTQWQYENEVRIIRQLRNCRYVGRQDLREFPIYIQPIALDAIKSVILGERMPYKKMRDIYEQLKDTAVAIDISAIDMSGFAFRREKIKLSSPSLGPVLSPRTANIFASLNSPLGQVARHILQHHAMSKIVNKPV